MKRSTRSPSVLRQPRRLNWSAWASALALSAGGQSVLAQQTQLLPTHKPCSDCTQPGIQPLKPAPKPSATAQPAMSQPTAVFRLNDLRLTGTQALSAEELRSITAPYIGRDVSLADLESLAQAMTARYRERGYFLAQALVPAQTVQNGVVEISVVEGRIGKLEINRAPSAPISEARVRGFLSALAVGEPVHGPAYERGMLLLSDQPGVRVDSALQAGAQTGTTDLTVEVNPTRRWSSSVDLDNHGTEESGRYRLGGALRVNSPLGIGDNFDVRALVSDGSGVYLGRLAYEAPLGSSGMRLGGGLARVHYELGGAFAALGAQGKADVADLSLSYPLIRQRGHSLFVRASADSKRLTDEFTEVDLSIHKRVQGMGLGWTWERRDDLGGGGYWASAGTLYHGKLSIRDAAVLALDQDAGGPHTQGSFGKFSLQVSRLQALFGAHTLFVALGGQWASKNLDGSEKLALGGARAVRAYPSGEVLVDQGFIGTAEWRWSLNKQLTPFVFYDAARGQSIKKPGLLDLGPSQRSLRGGGLGLSWRYSNDFSLNATLAWRAGTPAAQTDGGGHNPRLYVQMQKSF